MPQLYKYLSTERLDVLQRGLIRFTQATALNDPFELQPYFTQLKKGQPLEKVRPDFEEVEAAVRRQWLPTNASHEQRTVVETVLAMLRQNPNVLEGIFSNLEPALKTMGDAVTSYARQEMAKHLRNRIGILSLSDIPNDPVMWAHYASDHQGYVIGVASEHPYFNRQRGPNDQFFHLRKVVYRARQAGEVAIDEVQSDLLMMKDPSWSYEREWRMLVPFEIAPPSQTIETRGDTVQLYVLPKDAVCSVILGAKVSKDFECQVRQLAGLGSPNPEVKVARANLDIIARTIRIVPA